ncbi:hypothetical protein J6590_039293 [Homalodisca vitripennis]|nr:hypothetical protein J6590_039293 [Homalodisca vitripennis]
MLDYKASSGESPNEETDRHMPPPSQTMRNVQQYDSPGYRGLAQWGGYTWSNHSTGVILDYKASSGESPNEETDRHMPPPSQTMRNVQQYDSPGYRGLAQWGGYTWSNHSNGVILDYKASSGESPNEETDRHMPSPSQTMRNIQQYDSPRF